MGGYMGLLLGASAVTLFEVIDLILLQCTLWRRKSRTDMIDKEERTNDNILTISNHFNDTRL